MAYNNNAYDLERFAPRSNTAPKRNSEKKAVIKKFPVKQNKTAVNRGIVINVIVAISIALLICCNIYIRTEINDTKKAIANADKQIETLLSEQTRLNVEMEKIVSYSTLEEQAIAMGMQKKSKSQVHYIDTSSKDYAEIIDD